MNFNGLYEQFKSQYMLTNPPPQIKRISGVGWDFWLSLLWATTSVLMVASQTSFEFYMAKVLSGMYAILAGIAAFMVIFAVDGGLVIGAAIKAATKREYNKNLIQLAIWLCAGISTAAGVNSTIGIVTDINPSVVYNVRIGLLLALGIGGSLLAWTSGEILGSRLADVFSRRELIIKEHDLALEEYNQKMLASWKASPAYVIAMAEVRSEAASVRANQAGNFPKLSESFKKPPDYRKLSANQKLELLDMSTDQIMEAYLLQERTAYNWREFAERDFASMDKNDGNGNHA